MSADKATIQEALGQLDPEKDEHWTDNGDPRVDVVRQLTGAQDLTRNDITQAAPEFSRANATLPGEQAEAPTEAPTEQEPEQEPADDPEPTEGEAVDQLDALQAERNAIHTQINELRRKEDALVRRIDEIIIERERNHTSTSDQAAIKEYQKRQNEIRLQRAGRRQEILKGLDPKDLADKSMLDQSMARNRNRGQDRPQRPAMNQPQE